MTYCIADPVWLYPDATLEKNPDPVPTLEQTRSYNFLPNKISFYIFFRHKI